MDIMINSMADFMANNGDIILGLGERATSILSKVGVIGGALVGIALIFSIVKDAMGYIKGSGSNSIGKIIGKVLLLIVMIGIITVAANRGFDTLGKNGAKKMDNLASDGLNDLN